MATQETLNNPYILAFIGYGIALIGGFIKIKIDIAKLQERINADAKYIDTIRNASDIACKDHKSSINEIIIQMQNKQSTSEMYISKVLDENREDHNKLFDKIDKINDKIDENFKIVIDKIK